MQNDEIEDALLMAREFLHASQRGHPYDAGRVAEMLERALALRAEEMANRGPR